MRMETIVLTCDKNNWLLRGFYHQWMKYCPKLDPVTFGYKEPEVFGHKFVRIGDQSYYPANQWSDALILVLDELISDDLVLILLEDYWLTRDANFRIIEAAMAFMHRHPDAIRFDLTTDRQYSSKYKYYSAEGDIDIIEGLPCEYYLSFQAAIWNRKNLLSLLEPGESPWQTELLGSDRLAATNLKVFGTLQWPLRYQIMVRNGELVIDGNWMYPPRQLSESDLKELKELNYI